MFFHLIAAYRDPTAISWWWHLRWRDRREEDVWLGEEGQQRAVWLWPGSSHGGKRYGELQGASSSNGITFKYKVCIVMIIITKLILSYLLSISLPSVPLPLPSLFCFRLHLWVCPERRTEGAHCFQATWWTWNTVGLGFSPVFTCPY